MLTRPRGAGPITLCGAVLVAFSSTSAAAQTTAPTATAAGAPLTLAEATSTALARNSVAVAAGQQFAQAQARLSQAEAALRFQISFSSSVGVSSANVIQPPPSQETFGSFANSISVPLPISRKIRLTIGQAEAQRDAARATFDSARLSLSAQVTAAYYDLLRKQALLAIAQDQQTIANRQLGDAQKRFQAGDVPELDVLRAQVPVAAVKASGYQAETDVTLAEETLNSLIGRPLDDPIAPAAPLANSPTPTLTIEEARARAVKNSPDVRSAEAAERAASFGTRIAGQSREPLYALQASDTRTNDQTSFSRLDTLQATVTIPLSDGGLAKAQRREATALLAQAHAQAETARRAALLAVSAAYLNVRNSLQMTESTRIAQEIAQTTYDKTSRGYSAGLFPLTDVLSAQSALTQARIARTQALYDAAVARAALDNAIGIVP